MRRFGFTVIEMLVVIAIIGLLSTLAIIAYSSARQKTRDTMRAGDVAQLRKALEIYSNVHGVFPTALGNGEIGNPPIGAGCLGSVGWEPAIPCTSPIYLGRAPRDPGSAVNVPHNDRPCRAYAAPCNYSYTLITNDQFEIHFRLESGTGGLNTGLNCATESGVAPACAH